MPVMTVDARLAALDVKHISIPEERHFNGKPFPYTLSPTSGGAASLAAWGAEHRDALLELVEEYDCVLLRGFDGAASAMDFSHFANALKLGDFDAGCSAAPRTNVAPGVFTANEAPPSEPIPFHHEMAQCDERPDFLFFFCEKPAVERGATPIIPSHAVVHHLEETYPEIAQKLRTLGVRYVRTLPEENDPSSPIGKSWKASFDATTRAEAEAAMAAVGTEWTWLPNGDVRTVTKPMPALVYHDATEREMFFNSVVAATQGWIDVRNDPADAVIFGDGSPLDAEAREAIASVANFLADQRVAFSWQAGDVLMIDNHKAMHSREPFVAPRRVLASLWAADTPTSDNGDDPATGRLLSILPLRLGRGASALLRRAQEGAASAALRLRGGMASGTVTSQALTLRSGASMPAVGLGLWKVPRDVCAETVLGAIRAGYRHLDCACDYGNEVEVGEGIRAAIAEGLVTREELWITSKLWNTYHAREHVEPACRKSLQDLGLDYVDLYLVHFPISLKYVPFETRYPPEWVHDPDGPNPKMELVHVPFQETWEAMEALVPLGLTKHIGVCNFQAAGLRDLLAYAKIAPEVLQVELHPYLQQPKLLRYAAEQGIAVTGFSPLGAGSYVELGMSEEADSALKNPHVVKLAASKGVSPAQLILKWGLQRGLSVIPKSRSAARLAENIALDGFTLSDEEMDEMATLDQNRRFNDPGVFCLGMGAFCPIYD